MFKTAHTKYNIHFAFLCEISNCLVDQYRKTLKDLGIFHRKTNTQQAQVFVGALSKNFPRIYL